MNSFEKPAPEQKGKGESRLYFGQRLHDLLVNLKEDPQLQAVSQEH
jgi:hypothetical protein